MPETETTLAQFIAQHELTADVEYADSNPNLADDDWAANHWTVTIRRINTTMEVPFSQGSAHTEPPKLEEVLDCLASDASSIQQSYFEEWAADMGLFPMESGKDLQRARSVYDAIERQTTELRMLLGDEALDQLLYHTERL